MKSKFILNKKSNNIEKRKKYFSERYKSVTKFSIWEFQI